MSADQSEDLITFYLNRQLFALDLFPVTEVVYLPEITLLGDSSATVPSRISGIFNLRGTIVPVVDLKAAIGLSSVPFRLSQRIVVVKHGGSSFGLIVDGVDAVVSLRRADVSSVPAVYSGIPRQYIKGIGRGSEGLIIILDVVALLNSFQDSYEEAKDAQRAAIG